MNILKNTKMLVLLGGIVGAKLGSMLYKKKHPKEWVVIEQGSDFIKIIPKK